MKSNNTADRRGLEDLVAEHNLEINETKERVRQLEQRAEVPFSFQPETADAIAESIANRVAEACRLVKPDLSGVDEVIRKAAEAGVCHALSKRTLRIETETTHRWSESQENKMNALMDKADKLLHIVSETQITSWKKWLRNGAAIACPVVTLLFVFAIILYTDSPQYWGKRYYQICNHPLQTNEKLLEHKQDAYELVIALFANGRENKRRMKAHIREQEQRLKGKEIEHGKGE